MGLEARAFARSRCGKGELRLLRKDGIIFLFITPRHLAGGILDKRSRAALQYDVAVLFNDSFWQKSSGLVITTQACATGGNVALAIVRSEYEMWYSQLAVNVVGKISAAGN